VPGAAGGISYFSSGSAKRADTTGVTADALQSEKINAIVIKTTVAEGVEDLMYGSTWLCWLK
jgi:hypothetical protein